MKIYNLTKNDLVLYTENGIVTLTASNKPATVITKVVATGVIGDNKQIKYYTKKLYVNDLPDATDDTAYIVTADVATLLRYKRNDLYVPVDELYDKDGTLTGYRRLVKVK